MRIQHRLSVEGSDRGTGYNMSCKLIRRGDTLFVGWLDAPAGKGDQAQIMLGVCDVKTGEMRKAFQLGEGIDNHCGPAMVLDGNGRLHVMIGAHHGPFLYRWSDDPEAEGSWSEAEPLGPLDTYPSMAVDEEGTLHLAFRERGDRWQLGYRRKRSGQDWEEHRAMATSPTPGYNHHMQSLTVGPTGTLHLVFQFHYAESGRAEDCLGRAAVHVQSDDGGDRWFNEDLEVRDPITIESMRPICHYPEGGDEPHGVRVGNHVVDADNHPWFFSSLPEKQGGVLWRRTAQGWDGIDLADVFPDLNMEGGRSASLSRDGDGRIHLMVATNPHGGRVKWYDPIQELFYLILDASGNKISLTQVTENDPEASQWLPALEQWDWTRPDVDFSDGHWFLYTRGLNAGGIGGDNKSALKTEVYLGKV